MNVPPTELQTAPAPSYNLEATRELLARPLLDLVFEAARVHRQHHDSRSVQCAQLISVKTGGCPEDCGYCSQSARHGGGVEASPMMQVDSVVEEARRAKEGGADRFCMGAAWREVRDGPDFERVLAMVREVKAMGLETCATLGMLNGEQAKRLKVAGLDFYNHNLDTGRGHYQDVVKSREYDDRLETLKTARDAGLNLCCGGILGLGEKQRDRAELLHELAQMSPPPESVPINTLVPIEGTPMEDNAAVDWSEVVRTIAAARVLMPQCDLRLSAGRLQMEESMQALCFLAGANSLFVGDHLLTTPNPGQGSDAELLDKLGLIPKARTTAGHDAAP